MQSCRGSQSLVAATKQGNQETQVRNKYTKKRNTSRTYVLSFASKSNPHPSITKVGALRHPSTRRSPPIATLAHAAPLLNVGSSSIAWGTAARNHTPLQNIILHKQCHLCTPSLNKGHGMKHLVPSLANFKAFHDAAPTRIVPLWSPG
jgi:hypothetical protein